jgi:elongation factor P
MASYYTATNIRAGHTIEVEGEIYRVLNATHITPGKGNAVMQVKMRNLKTGIQRELRFRSVETVKQVELDIVKMEYLYDDGEMAHFMNHDTYEQVALPLERVEHELHYLLPNTVVQMQVYESEIVGIDLPKVVELKVVETAPPIRGVTAAAQTKPAKLETGLVINVPAFLEDGVIVRVDTETGAYIERARS